jgi:hypothetical protein
MRKTDLKIFMILKFSEILLIIANNLKFMNHGKHKTFSNPCFGRTRKWEGNSMQINKQGFWFRSFISRGFTPSRSNPLFPFFTPKEGLKI